MVQSVTSSQPINAYRTPPLQGNGRGVVLHNLMRVENTSPGKNFITGQKASMTNEVLTPSVLQDTRRSLKPTDSRAQSMSVIYNFSDSIKSDNSRPGPSQDEQKQPEKSRGLSPHVIKAVENTEQGKSDIDGPPILRIDQPYKLQSPSLIMAAINFLKAEKQPEKEQTLLTTKKVID